MRGINTVQKDLADKMIQSPYANLIQRIDELIAFCNSDDVTNTSLFSGITNPFRSEEIPDQHAKQKLNVSAQLVSFREQAHNGLSKNLQHPFSFAPTIALIDACNNGIAKDTIKVKILQTCRMQFYTVLLLKIDYVIAQLRHKLTIEEQRDAQKKPIASLATLPSLNANANLRGNEQALMDPLNRHDYGKALLALRKTLITSFSSRQNSRFNYAELFLLKEMCDNNKFSSEIRNIIDEIHAMIIADIKNPKLNNGASFFYHGFNITTAVKLIEEFYQLDRQMAAGERIWRIFLGLDAQTIMAIINTHAKLIAQVKKLNSYTQHDPLNNEDSALCRLVIENPRLLVFFTTRQFIGIIQSPDATFIEALQKNLNYLKTEDQLAQTYRNSVFYRALNTTSNIEKSTDTDILNVLKKLKAINTLLCFLVDQAPDICELANASVATIDFMFVLGVCPQLLDLLSPQTVIDLLQNAERYAALAKKAIDNSEEFTKFRDSIECQWIITRIIGEIKKGDHQYYAKLKTISGLLLSLLKVDEFSMIDEQILANFFNELGHELILETLQLVDPEDKKQTITVNHEQFKMFKVNMDGGSDEQYEFHISGAQVIYKLFAELLLSEKMKPVRLSWLKNKKAEKLMRTYPFLLSGADHNTLNTFIGDNAEDIVAQSNHCIDGGINPFLYCPLLLAYLPVDQLLTKKQYSVLLDLFTQQKVPPEVIIHYIIKGDFDTLAQSVKAYADYLNPTFFRLAKPELLDVTLLSRMVSEDSKLTKHALQKYPSCLTYFSDQVISECAPYSLLLRHVLRQQLLSQFILDNLAHLLETNFALLKIIIAILYRNPESEIIIAKIEERLDSLRKMAELRFDQEADQSLYELMLDKLKFNVTLNSYPDSYPEYQTIEAIKIIVEEKIPKKTMTMSRSSKDRNKIALTNIMRCILQCILENKDPVIFLIDPLLTAYPSWACRFINSAGIYPALRQYCYATLSHCIGNLKATNDHYPAIYQYALLLNETGDYEKAAELLKQFIEYVGVNASMHSDAGSDIDLLLECTDRLIVLDDPECADRLNNANFLIVINRYIYAATALLSADTLPGISTRLPMQGVELDLSEEAAKRFASTINRVKALQHWYERVIDFTKKSMDLLIEIHQRNNTTKDLRLALMSLLAALLNKVIDADHHSTKIKDISIALGYHIKSLGFLHFGMARDEFEQIIAKNVKLLDTHALVNPGTGELRPPKKTWVYPQESIRSENQFLLDFAYLLTQIHIIIKNNEIVLQSESRSSKRVLINEIVSVLNAGVTRYNESHRYMLPDLIRLIHARILILKEMKSSVFSLVQQRFVNSEKKAQKKLQQQKNGISLNANSNKLFFSPYDRSRVMEEVEELFEDMLLLPTTKYPSEYPCKKRAELFDRIIKPTLINQKIPPKSAIATEKEETPASFNLLGNVVISSEEHSELQNLFAQQLQRKKSLADAVNQSTVDDTTSKNTAAAQDIHREIDDLIENETDLVAVAEEEARKKKAQKEKSMQLEPQADDVADQNNFQGDVREKAPEEMKIEQQDLDSAEDAISVEIRNITSKIASEKDSTKNSATYQAKLNAAIELAQNQELFYRELEILTRNLATEKDEQLAKVLTDRKKILELAQRIKELNELKAALELAQSEESLNVEIIKLTRKIANEKDDQTIIDLSNLKKSLEHAQEIKLNKVVEAIKDKHALAKARIIARQKEKQKEQQNKESDEKTDQKRGSARSSSMRRLTRQNSMQSVGAPQTEIPLVDLETASPAYQTLIDIKRRQEAEQRDSEFAIGELQGNRVGRASTTPQQIQTNVVRKHEMTAKELEDKRLYNEQKARIAQQEERLAKALADGGTNKSRKSQDPLKMTQNQSDTLNRSTRQGESPATQTASARTATVEISMASTNTKPERSSVNESALSASVGITVAHNPYQGQVLLSDQEKEKPSATVTAPSMKSRESLVTGDLKERLAAEEKAKKDREDKLRERLARKDREQALKAAEASTPASQPTTVAEQLTRFGVFKPPATPADLSVKPATQTVAEHTLSQC